MATNNFSSVLNLDELLDESVASREANRPRRKPTLLKMQWIAERVRRAERIKQQMMAGTYQVESKRVARAILNISENE